MRLSDILEMLAELKSGAVSLQDFYGASVYRDISEKLTEMNDLEPDEAINCCRVFSSNLRIIARLIYEMIGDRGAKSSQAEQDDAT